MLNTCSFIGRIVNELELNHSNSGKSWLKFTLAVQRDYKNGKGDYEADFIPITCFGATAEFVEKYLEKGKLVGVSGKFTSSQKENEDGKKTNYYSINADKVYPIEWRATDKTEETNANNDLDLDSIINL